MPHKIVLIDDEAVQANRFKSQLESLGFDVEFVNTQINYGAMRRKLNSKAWNDVDLYLVDVMMPPEGPKGRYNKQRTEDGLTTGLFVAQDIREKHKLTPIILWSTVPFNVIAAAARNTAKVIPSCAFIKKNEGVETVKKMFDSFAKTGRLETIWKKFSFDVLNPETLTSLKTVIEIVKALLPG